MASGLSRGIVPAGDVAGERHCLQASTSYGRHVITGRLSYIYTLVPQSIYCFQKAMASNVLCPASVEGDLGAALQTRPCSGQKCVPYPVLVSLDAIVNANQVPLSQTPNSKSMHMLFLSRPRGGRPCATPGGDQSSASAVLLVLPGTCREEVDQEQYCCAKITQQ